jgi:uncharacterized protein
MQSGDIMLIGLISDSHDNIQGLKDALDLLKGRCVDLVLHAGDMVGSGNCYVFEDSGMDIRLVYGNNDGDRVGLYRDFKRVGGEYLGDFGEIEADGRKIAILHGTDEGIIHSLVRSGMYDVIVRGHNHRFEVARGEKTLLVNPGEIWGHFTGYRTIAILDTSNLQVERIDLGRCKTFREMLEL